MTGLAKKIVKLFPLSDVHLEKGVWVTLKNVGQADVAILAGDIGNPFKANYSRFLSNISKEFKDVILISGNHEYWDESCRVSMDEVECQTREVVGGFPNVHYLQKGELRLGGLRYLGCTLWAPPDPHLMPVSGDRLFIEGMSYERCIQLYEDHRDWLKGKLEETCDLKTVVVTHHMPSFRMCHPKYREHRMRSFFASNLEELIPLADLWVCGHSHTAMRETFGGTVCLSNPFGYINEDETGFDEKLVVAIPIDDPATK